ncbi:SDR family NAD(P)-dependent oxidoreductase [Rubrobacter aplysinae]|uniref:SDR family NAD(P)-dependent oxidoreductase n=1 Tax=Rubrobacter aplysinae TaxID=909625 RepID=UPI00064BA8AF|nr:SDR family oxidoreductase [Rubrobacter aplysinae]
MDNASDQNNQNDQNDQSPVYVVLGATSGIGSELCKRLAAQDGARLVLGGRDRDKLDGLTGELDAETRTVELDATDTGAVDGLFETAFSEFGGVTGAVNCVGAFLLKPAHMTSDEEFEEQLTLNLKTAFYVVKAAANRMREGGSVVLLSSVAGRVGLENHEAVAASKAGVTGLAMSAAATYVARGLRFNVVSPGLIQTPMTESVTRSETSREASRQLHPLNRLGEPGDIAAMISWLLDPAQDWVTGQDFGVDGGLSTLRPLPRRSSKSG